jgi:hypothetical protein
VAQPLDASIDKILNHYAAIRESDDGSNPEKRRKNSLDSANLSDFSLAAKDLKINTSVLMAGTVGVRVW